MGRHVGVLMLLGALCTGVGAGPGESISATAVRPQLDVVVETSLPATAERRKAYLEQMLAYGRACLTGLVPAKAHPADKAPPDGAVPYRLFIDHDGRIDVDAMSTPAEIVGEEDTDAQRFITRQKGVFHVRLGRWDGSSYPTVDRWSSRFQTQNFLPMPGDVSPEERAQYRRVALNLAKPEAVKGAILRRWVPVDIAKTEGDPGETLRVTLAVANRSLWPLRRLDLTVVWIVRKDGERYRYLAKAAFDGRLESGKATELVTEAKRDPSPFGWEYSLPMQIDARPVFVPEVVDTK